MAKLVDAPDLGSGAERCESSSLSVRTTLKMSSFRAAFFTSIPLYTPFEIELLLQSVSIVLFQDGLSFMLNPSQKLVELVRILEERAYIFPGDPVQATEALRHIDGGNEEN